MCANFQRVSIDLEQEHDLKNIAKKCFKKTKMYGKTKHFCTKELGNFLKEYYRDEEEMINLRVSDVKRIRIGEPPSRSGFQYHIGNPKLAIYDANNIVVIYAFLGFFGCQDGRNHAKRIVWFINKNDVTIANVLTKEKSNDRDRFYVRKNVQSCLDFGITQLSSYFKAMKIRSGVVEDNICVGVEIKHLVSVGAAEYETPYLKYGKRTYCMRKLPSNTLSFQQGVPTENLTSAMHDWRFTID